jgi:hypothetical protein
LIWFVVTSFWAFCSSLVFVMSVVVAITPDARTSPLLVLGALLLAILTIATAFGVRRVTRRAAVATRVFGVLSGIVLGMMVNTPRDPSGVAAAVSCRLASRSRA